MDNFYNLDFSKIGDNLFSNKELEVLNCFSTRDVDLEKLKTLGEVEEIISEKDGIETRVILFKGDDGQMFERTYTYRKKQHYAEKVRSINERIEKAISEENYERASELKKLKIELLEQSDYKE